MIMSLTGFRCMHLAVCSQHLRLGLAVSETFTVPCRAQGAAALVDTSINSLRHCYRAVLRQ